VPNTSKLANSSHRNTAMCCCAGRPLLPTARYSRLLRKCLSPEQQPDHVLEDSIACFEVDFCAQRFVLGLFGVLGRRSEWKVSDS
jgi:hypothetical protein